MNNLSPFCRASGGINSVMARDAKQHEVFRAVPSTLGEGADVMHTRAGK